MAKCPKRRKDISNIGSSLGKTFEKARYVQRNVGYLLWLAWVGEANRRDKGEKDSQPGSALYKVLRNLNLREGVKGKWHDLICIL